MSADDPVLASRRQKRLADEAAGNAVALTVAERLTRRAKNKTIDLPLTDEDGDYNIEMRSPTRKCLDKLLAYQTAIKKPEEQVVANEKICRALDYLCIDESLNYDYWINGDYDVNDLVLIIQKLFENFANIIKEAESFRSNGTRARTPSTERISQEVSA